MLPIVFESRRTVPEHQLHSMPTKKRIQYRYTPTGQRSALIDPDGGRFTYTYDSVKRLTQVINPQRL